MNKYEYTIGRTLDLKAEQYKTLTSPPLYSNFVLKAMYLTFDILYGRELSLPKVKALEILARYPYWAWENGAYHLISRLFSTTTKVSAENISAPLNWINMGREAQDNEQDHLFLMEQVIHHKGIKLGWFNNSFLPKVMAFKYLLLTRIMFKIKPAWSFNMNAAFESHAEHEYMKLAHAHPEWDNENIDYLNFRKYPPQNSLGDLVRRAPEHGRRLGEQLLIAGLRVDVSLQHGPIVCGRSRAALGCCAGLPLDQRFSLSHLTFSFFSAASAAVPFRARSIFATMCGRSGRSGSAACDVPTAVPAAVRRPAARAIRC